MKPLANETVDAGTGDVFRDSGYADAEERILRVQLAMRVNEIIKDSASSKPQPQRCSPFESRTSR